MPISNYLSAPAFGWDEMLSMTYVELDLISDLDILFLEKGMKDGVPCISKRYQKANNKQLLSRDPKKTTKYITYFDKNNLYGCAVIISFNGQDSVDGSCKILINK